MNLGCPVPDSSVCIAAWLARVQTVTAHSHAIKLYPPSRYLMVMLTCEGAYQNTVILASAFVVQHNGSKHLCWSSIKYWLAMMLFKAQSDDCVNNIKYNGWKFQFALSVQYT